MANVFYTVPGVPKTDEGRINPPLESEQDGSAKYAVAQGHILEFEDVRDTTDDGRIAFKAFLNGFSQSFSSNWNTEPVFGRMDDIATFKNTTRSISVSWEVAATNVQNAAVNLKRCNKLIQLLYPTYDAGSANTMSKAPFVRIKYANLLQSAAGTGLFGYITSLTWTPVLDMGYFHMEGGIYPKVITISVEFTAIHSGEKGETGYFDNRNDAAGDNYGLQSGKINFPFGGSKS